MLFSALLWVIWCSLTCAVIIFDHRHRVAAAEANGTVDFSDGDPRGYLMLSFLTSALVLPMYFYATRKKASALLVGMGWSLVCTVTSVIAFAMVLFVAGMAAAVVS